MPDPTHFAQLIAARLLSQRDARDCLAATGVIGAGRDCKRATEAAH